MEVIRKCIYIIVLGSVFRFIMMLLSYEKNMNDIKFFFWVLILFICVVLFKNKFKFGYVSYLRI